VINVGDLDRRRLVVPCWRPCCSPAPWPLGDCLVDTTSIGAGRIELSDEELRLRFSRSSL
jgi:hypothetical protein